MSRSACLCALVGAAAAAMLNIGGARAEQSGQAVGAKQTAARAAPAPATGTGAPAGIPAIGAPAAMRAPGSAPTSAQAQTAPIQAQPMTPAEIKYGLPKTPQVGGPVDTDLTKPLSLLRAIQIGLLRQNSIAIAATQADVAQNRVVQARSSYYPQVTPTFQYQTNLSPGGSVFINGQRFSASSTSETRTELIAARQLIFDTGRREANVGAARRNSFASEYALGNSRQDVVLAVTTNYFNLLRDRELVRVEEESVKRAEETTKAIQAEFEAGTAARSDTLQSQSDLANARVALLSAQNDYQVQEANLKNSMGVVGVAPLTLDPTPVPAPNTAADPRPLTTYIRTAYMNRLDVKQLQEQVYSQGYNVRLAQINAGLSFQADVTEGYQLDPVSGEERTFIVSATYPLFDAGNTRAVVRENKAQWEAAKRTLDQLEQTIRLNVDQSFSTREISKQRLLAANVAVTAANENYQAALAKNKQGLINILEVINAEVLLINAQVQQVQANYDYYIADAQLTRDIGLNDPIYLPRVPGVKPPVPPAP